jgi:aminopeptidase N
MLILFYFHYSSSVSPSSQPFLTPVPSITSQVDPLYDISSLANINEVRTLHYHLALKVDFESQIFSGVNTLTLSSLIPNLTEVHLDVRNLSILEIYDDNHNKIPFRIEDNPFGDESIGDQLRILLLQTPQLFSPFNIHISYKTSPTATALNWLTPEQTSSKTQPYLFSQCE